MRTIAALTPRLLAGLAFTFSMSVQAANLVGTGGADVIIGADDDNVDNPQVQNFDPPPNQSLNNTDIIRGLRGHDVLIGLLGNDTISGGAGRDVLIGGTEQFVGPNSDLMFGGIGNDVNIWAPGDGSDAFDGGIGHKDAQVFGVIDRDSYDVPILTPTWGAHKKTGLPSADLTGSPGFCRIERVEDPDFGFDFLVRFFVRASGNQAVTVRLRDVEQVFCTSEAGGRITFADLTHPYPYFVEVSRHDVAKLNYTVFKIVR
ncbi:MAG: hypothetical protein ACR2RL_08815 [Gammaproteobacteria bacterium]